MEPVERPLTEAEQTALMELCERLADRDPETVATARFTHPIELLQLERELRDPESGAAERLFILTGMPGAPDPRHALTVLGRLLGPIIVKHTGEGDYIVEIRDDPTRAGERPFFANSREFFPHTDFSYVPDPPPFVVMHSLANDPGQGGTSLFTDCEEVAAALASDTVAELARPQFRFTAPEHFDGPPLEWAPVLTRDNGKVRIRFRRDKVQANTRSGSDALDDLATAIQAHTVEHHLAPGTVALVDNRRFLHGRTAFVPSIETDRPRHINRMYVGEQLAPVRG
jgi:alpha-ketoglutarate-dependent taurine dioxygenase